MTTIETAPSELISVRAAFFRLWVLGLPGAAAAASEPLASSLLAGAGLPEVVLRGFNFTMTALVLAALVGLGTIAAAPVGLGSRLAPQVPREVRSRGTAFHWVQAGVLIGIAAAIGHALMDTVFWSFIAEADRYLLRSAAEESVAEPVTRLLFGAITEELMLRFGLMSGALWLLCLMMGVPRGPAPARLAWAAIIGTSLFVAAGYAPSLMHLFFSSGAPADPAAVLLLRSVVIGVPTGIAYGWLYWRHGLEAAILAHLVAVTGLIVFEGLAPV